MEEMKKGNDWFLVNYQNLVENNRDILLAAIHRGYGNNLDFSSRITKKFKDDEEVIKEVVKRVRSGLKHASIRLMNSKRL